MKVYRGPESLPFWDDRHEYVSSVKPEILEASLRDGSCIKFNISKEATERRAVCTARFDSEDIVPMISGLLSRLQAHQTALLAIKHLIKEENLDGSDKLEQIRQLVQDL
jgi:hypothetical protein